MEEVNHVRLVGQVCEKPASLKYGTKIFAIFAGMFDQFYHQASDQMKLSFLEEAFRKHPHLKGDFLEFYVKPSGPLKFTMHDPEDYIRASTDLLKESLEAIDLKEPDWEHYVPRHSGYIPEYEAMEHLAEDKINGIIGFQVHEAQSYCEEKKFDLAFLCLISIYQACTEAELDDEYEALPDATYTMLNAFETHLHDMMPLFKAINVPEDQLFTIASALVDHGQKHYPEDQEFLRFFELYLFSIIHSGTAASIVMDLIEEKKVAAHIPWLMTELHRMTGGNQAWEQAARQLYKADKSVASSLLEFYKTEDRQKFVHIARELWYDELFRNEFAALYFEVLDPGDDPDLYREVAIYLTDQEFTEQYYLALQSLMTKEERQAYIETFKGNSTAYTKALCMEGKYTEALEFVDKKINRWNLADLIAPCLAGLPETTIHLLERKVNELLEKERGRNFYERIASALKMAAEVSTHRMEVERLAHRLYTTYSRLSAFRGELRKAGLVRV